MINAVFDKGELVDHVKGVFPDILIIDQLDY